jgi:hypothetical protein
MHLHFIKCQNEISLTILLICEVSVLERSTNIEISSCRLASLEYAQFSADHAIHCRIPGPALLHLLKEPKQHEVRYLKDS